MGTLRAILVSGVLGLVGCPADDGGESTNTTEGTSTATTTGSGSGASSGGMSMSSTSSSSTDEGTSSSSDGSTTEVATGPVNTTGSSSSSGEDPTNGGDACDPEAQEHPCLECFVDDCCKSWTMCLADEGCTCIVDCHVIEGGSLGGCESQCDSDGELYQALFFCGQMYCLGTCEWDCC
jgi:hypothetical protein